MPGAAWVPQRVRALAIACAYVGMTRGRHHNIAHLVTESLDDARSQWIDVFSRDRADLGPGHAGRRAADDIDRYGPNSLSPSAVAEARRFLASATTRVEVRSDD
jgi:hypothetical protein